MPPMKPSEESRIAMIDVDSAEAEAARFFQGAIDMLGRVPNSYRVFARSPETAKMLLPFNAVMLPALNPAAGKHDGQVATGV